jgi:protein gp37
MSHSPPSKHEQTVLRALRDGWYIEEILRDQCVAAGVPFHWKQHGEWCAFDQLPQETLAAVELYKYPVQVVDGRSYHRVGKAKAGRLLDGREWDEFPNATVV